MAGWWVHKHYVGYSSPKGCHNFACGLCHCLRPIGTEWNWEGGDEN